LLLLDISNNEYVWTSFFASSSITNKPNHLTSFTSPSATTTNIQPNKQSNTITDHSDVLTGVIIGAIVNGILFMVGIFYLYKWYKNKRERNNADITQSVDGRI
jgi:hypothetical protein